MDATDTAPVCADIEEQLRELPLLPVVAVKMLSLNRESADYFDDITRLAGQDPTFAVRLIRIANSSALATRTPITNLKTAIIRLGTAQIAALVTSMAVMRIFVPSSSEARDLWLHSIQVAQAARAVAVLGKDLQVNPDDAFLAGLLHDIGRFILIRTAHHVLRTLDENDWDSAGQLIASEQEICGYDHTQLGWRICRKWQLPEPIVSVVRSHHELDIAADGSAHANLRNLVRITRLADNLSMAALQATRQPADGAATGAAIGARCSALLETDPFISLTELQAAVPGILAEADRQFAMLGLPA
ncbi:MAG: HDOD domain-containing protein [Pseudomonadota bacterium]